MKGTDHDEARERYEKAVELVALIRAEWDDLGRPLLLEHPNGFQGPHPLVKMLTDAAKDADRLAKSLAPASRPGREPVARIEADDDRAEPNAMRSILDELPPLRLKRAK